MKNLDDYLNPKLLRKADSVTVNRNTVTMKFNTVTYEVRRSADQNALAVDIYYEGLFVKKVLSRELSSEVYNNFYATAHEVTRTVALTAKKWATLKTDVLLTGVLTESRHHE